MFFVHIVFELVNEEGEDSIDVSGNKICIYGVKLKGFFMKMVERAVCRSMPVNCMFGRR
jgi:hypothetical protein